MHKYELVLEASLGRPALRIELIAYDASVAVCWAERHAHGRKFEIFEDGRSLGSAALWDGANFWILSPAPTRRSRARRVPAPMAVAASLAE